MKRAHERSAATEGKFFFRNNVGYTVEDGGPASVISKGIGDKLDEGNGYANKAIYEHQSSPSDLDPETWLEEMSLLQIMEGKVRYHTV